MKKALDRGLNHGTSLAFWRLVDRLTYMAEPGLLYGRPGPNKSRRDLAPLKREGLAVVVRLVHIEDPAAVTRAGLKHYVMTFEEKLHLPYKTANGFVLDIFDEFEPRVEGHC